MRDAGGERLMRAIRQYELGPPDVLRYEQVPDPVPGDGQVLIEVAAAGVHLIDTRIRAGTQGPPAALPMTPGREVAGAAGGRRVVAHLGWASGGYAELAVAPADALHEIPDDLPADVAVAAIGTGRTAVGILELAELRAGDVVLVLGAAGGLGGLFLQAARNAGATSIAAARGQARLAGLDADIAVDYSHDDWTAGLPPTTLVLDGTGGELGRAALATLQPGGRIVIFGFASGTPTEVTTADLLKGIRAEGVGPRLLGRMRELETIALAEAAAGRLVPHVGSRFGLTQAADAHRAIEARATTGKVVLIP